MPSQPEETVDHDLGNILQLVRLARTGNVTEQERDTMLAHIEARAIAARAKLTPPPTPMPVEYLAGPGPAKLLRYYGCVRCQARHWEDERPIYDEHILDQSKHGVLYGHRTVELVR